MAAINIPVGPGSLIIGARYMGDFAQPIDLADVNYTVHFEVSLGRADSSGPIPAFTRRDLERE